MKFKHLDTDINTLSIGKYDQICKSGTLELLITDNDAFDRAFVLSFIDKIREILNSKRSVLWKISSFLWLTIGMYDHSTETVKTAKYRHLEKAFDYVDTQIFELRGASADLIKKTKLKKQIIILRDKVYNGNNTFASNRLRKLEIELADLEKHTITDYSVSKMMIIFTKELELKFAPKPFETSIVQFFDYSDILTEKHK